MRMKNNKYRSNIEDMVVMTYVDNIDKGTYFGVICYKEDGSYVIARNFANIKIKVVTYLNEESIIETIPRDLVMFLGSSIPVNNKLIKEIELETDNARRDIITLDKIVPGSIHYKRDVTFKGFLRNKEYDIYKNDTSYKLTKKKRAPIVKPYNPNGG